MTMQHSKKKNFPNTALRRQGSVNTLRLRALMDQQQRMEIGQRIRELREASPHTNESIADHVGVKPRSVANWISGTTGITYEHARKVADLFGVDHRWLWDGREREDGPGDLLGSLSERESPALAGISRLEDQIASLRTELLSELAQVRTAQEDRRQKPGRSGRKSATKPK